jgi:hypothetical protein
VVAAVALVGTSAAEARAPAPVLAVHGVRITVPAGCRRAGRLSICSQPHRVLALARTRHELLIGNASRYTGGLILLLESSGNAFRARHQFRLPAAATQFEGCCDQPSGPGYEFTFRDGGRDFYAFVYGTNRAVANEGVEILNTLRVRPLS